VAWWPSTDLLRNFFEPLSGAAELYARCQKTFASVRQVQFAFALRTKVANARDAVPLYRHHRIDQGDAIEFRDVEFSYPGQKYALYIPELRIRKGEHLGIAGDDGPERARWGNWWFGFMTRFWEASDAEARTSATFDWRACAGTSVTCRGNRSYLTGPLLPTFAW
jgi:ABC-type multidrug transport system fused ATPase/permease subunit